MGLLLIQLPSRLTQQGALTFLTSEQEVYMRQRDTAIPTLAGQPAFPFNCPLASGVVPSAGRQAPKKRGGFCSFSKPPRTRPFVSGKEHQAMVGCRLKVKALSNSC